MPIFLLRMPRNIQFIVLLCYFSATLMGGADLLAQGNEGRSLSASAALENPVQYKARDSAVYNFDDKKLYLYGDAEVTHDDMSLVAGYIVYDRENAEVYAEAVLDSAGEWIEIPHFTTGDQDFEAKKMVYQIERARGIIYEAYTEHEGATLSSKVAIRDSTTNIYGLSTRYTTCTNRDHPHFHLQANRSVVVPERGVYTGPVLLHVSEVPTPLGLPFALFPNTKGRRSGVIFPEPGEAPNAGFFLKGGGYFWAINDGFTLTTTADLYSRGLFGLNTDVQYKKRYKRNGRLQWSYFLTPSPDPDQADSKPSHDMRLTWSHQMDPKARPNSSFSANVSGSTRSYNNNSLQTTNQLLEVALTSRLSYSRKFIGKPYNLSIQARHDQNLQTGRISFTLPEVTFAVSRFTPLNSISTKKNLGKTPWYKRLGFTYSLRGKASVTSFDSLLFTPQFTESIQYGIRHNASADINLPVFKHINISPRFSYEEKWYPQTSTRRFQDTVFVDIPSGEVDTLFDQVFVDTLAGFQAIRSFDFSLTANTVLTGIFNLSQSKRLRAIRHVMKPSVSYTYRPDFGQEKWGYYGEYLNTTTGNTVVYDPYSILSSIYGGAPGRGGSNLFRIAINNTFDMKVCKPSKDSTATYCGPSPRVNMPYKNLVNLPLLEQLNLDWSYNFTADSLRSSPLTVNLQTKVGQYIRIQFRNTFDPYDVDSNNRRINTLYWETSKRFFRLTNSQLSLNLDLKGKPRQKKNLPESAGSMSEREYYLANMDAFYDFDIPWTLSARYNLNRQTGISYNPDTILFTQSLSMNGSVNITPKWKIVATTGYDFRNRDLTLTNVRVMRDLHCWSLSFNWTAYPISRQTYSIELRVLSDVLQFLKLSRQKPPGSFDDF